MTPARNLFVDFLETNSLLLLLLHFANHVFQSGVLLFRTVSHFLFFKPGFHYIVFHRQSLSQSIAADHRRRCKTVIGGELRFDENHALTKIVLSSLLDVPYNAIFSFSGFVQLELGSKKYKLSMFPRDLFPIGFDYLTLI